MADDFIKPLSPIVKTSNRPKNKSTPEKARAVRPRADSQDKKKQSRRNGKIDTYA